MIKGPSKQQFVSYKFNKVFCLLKNHYPKNIKEGQIIEDKNEYGDALGKEDWKVSLRHSIESFYPSKN